MSDYGVESEEGEDPGELVSEGDQNEAEAQVARIGLGVAASLKEDVRVAFRHKVSSVVHLAKDDSLPMKGRLQCSDVGDRPITIMSDSVLCLHVTPGSVQHVGCENRARSGSRASSVMFSGVLML